MVLTGRVAKQWVTFFCFSSGTMLCAIAHNEQGGANCPADTRNTDVASYIQLPIDHEKLSLKNGPNPHEIFGPTFERFVKKISIDAHTLLQPDSQNAVKHRSIAASFKSCPCTWNPAYPCSLKGSCYSLSTEASCKQHGGEFCGNGGGAPICSCTWNPAYPCSLHGTCYGYTSKASCEQNGGKFCGKSNPSPTPTPTPAPTPMSNPSPAPSDLQSALDQHNTYRQKHQAPALTWDASLANQAQSWANGCKWEHSTMGYGENLWAGTGTFNAASAVTSWYNELTNPGYNFNSPGFSSGTGHFTQVVWKASTKVGCAVKRCSNLAGPNWKNANLFVCEYDPPGNYHGQFQANVLPAK